jgi:hypothetical protein
MGNKSSTEIPIEATTSEVSPGQVVFRGSIIILYDVF